MEIESRWQMKSLYLRFNKKYPFNEMLLKDLNYNCNERLNLATVIGGTFLSKFIK